MLLDSFCFANIIILKLRKWLSVLIFSVSFIYNVYGQQQRTVPQNYFSVTGGIEWNTLSGLKGLELERYFFTINSFSLGFKGRYFFRYEQGNLQLLNGTCCSFSSLGTAMATGTFHIAKKQKTPGFFLHSGLGIGLVSHQRHDYFLQRKVTPGWEAGLGWQLNLGPKAVIRWTNSLLFATQNGGIALTQLSVGF
jgi:hypothetical protein